MVRESITPASPTESIDSASFLSRAPISTHSSLHANALLAVFRAYEVDGKLADDAEHVAVAAREAETLADENLRIPAADRPDVDVAVVVDVCGR